MCLLQTKKVLLSHFCGSLLGRQKLLEGSSFGPALGLLLLETLTLSGRQLVPLDQLSVLRLSDVKRALALRDALLQASELRGNRLGFIAPVAAAGIGNEHACAG